MGMEKEKTPRLEVRPPPPSLTLQKPYAAGFFCKQFSSMQPLCHWAAPDAYLHRISEDYFKPRTLIRIDNFTGIASMDRFPKAAVADK